MFQRVALVTAVTGTFALLAAPSFAAAPKSPTVSSGKTRLAMRVGPTTTSATLGYLRSGTKIAIVCQVTGQTVKGRVRKTDRWDRLANGLYISDAYVKRGYSPAICPPPPAPGPAKPIVTIIPPTGAVAIGQWVAPVPGHGTSGFRTASRPEHDGIDIMAARFTPIKATADGTVITVVCNTSGPSCDVDGGSDVRGCGWYVEIRHAGNLVTRYCHMVRQPEVSVGQQVAANQVIGYVGTSGHSSGPHLHFEVHFGVPPATRLNAIDPAAFMRSAGAPVS